MKTEVIKKNNIEVAVVSSDELLITDVQSALDLIMTVLTNKLSEEQAAQILP